MAPQAPATVGTASQSGGWSHLQGFAVAPRPARGALSNPSTGPRSPEEPGQPLPSTCMAGEPRQLSARSSESRPRKVVPGWKPPAGASQGPPASRAGS